MLEVFLAVATILGGIAAIIAIYKLLRRWRLLGHRASSSDSVVAFASRKWKRLRFRDHYLAWDGPLDCLEDRGDVDYNDSHSKTLRSGLKAMRWDLDFPLGPRQDERKAEGFSILCETDCRSWKSEVSRQINMPVMVKVWAWPRFALLSRLLIRLHPKRIVKRPDFLDDFSRLVLELLQINHPDYLPYVTAQRINPGWMLRLEFHPPNKALRGLVSLELDRTSERVEVHVGRVVKEFGYFEDWDLPRQLSEAVALLDRIRQDKATVTLFEKSGRIIAGQIADAEAAPMKPPLEAEKRVVTSWSGKWDHTEELCQ